MGILQGALRRATGKCQEPDCKPPKPAEWELRAGFMPEGVYHRLCTQHMLLWKTGYEATGIPGVEAKPLGTQASSVDTPSRRLDSSEEQRNPSASGLRSDPSWPGPFAVLRAATELEADDSTGGPLSAATLGRVERGLKLTESDFLDFFNGLVQPQIEEMDLALLAAMDARVRGWTESEEIVQDTLGYLLTAYQVGRRFLDTHATMVQYSPRDPAKVARNAAMLLVQDGSVDISDLLDPKSGLMTFLSNWAGYESETSPIAQAVDDPRLIIFTFTLAGVSFAVIEHDLFWTGN